ncbi:MAG: hypothetical protein KDB68_16345 [Planctomycetes bacterium]|nr:hypothetical protein [Planctomycetota bacterium]
MNPIRFAMLSALLSPLVGEEEAEPVGATLASPALLDDSDERETDE